MASKILSIELSNTTIRIVQMDYKTQNPRVYYHVVCNTPEASINDGYLINPDAVANAIRTALVSNRIKGTKNVIFTISSTKIVTREQQLPQMKPAQLDSMIQTNLSDYFPIDLDNYQVAYTVLGTIDEGKDAGKLRVSIMAAENNLVESYKQLAASCGLSLVQVDNVANSVYQVLKSENRPQCKMVLKIEENSTSVLVIKNESLLLQRNIGFGFLPAIREIMHQPAFQAVSEFDARNIAMKRACIRKTLNEGTMITDNEDMPEPSEGTAMTNARQAVTDSLEDLIKGIQRVLNYYNSTNSSNPLDVCYVCGAGGSINGISHLLSNELGLKVTVLRKLENVAYSVLGDNADLYNYVASIGAIYAPVGFFSKAKANKAKQTNYGKLIPLVVILAILIILAIVGKGFLDYKNAKDRNDELKVTEARYMESEQVYLKYAAVLDFYREVIAGEAATQRSTDNIADFLGELEQKMPTEMTISEFSSDDYRFTMKVDVLDKNTAIGIIETLRTFNTVSGLMVDSLVEVEETINPEDFEKIIGTFLVIDETGENGKPVVKETELEEGEEEEVAIITTNENDEEDSALHVKRIGTYYLRLDPETEKEIYVRKYVSFTVSCIYAPAEQVEIQSNVAGEGN